MGEIEGERKRVREVENRGKERKETGKGGEKRERNAGPVQEPLTLVYKENPWTKTPTRTYLAHHTL